MCQRFTNSFTTTTTIYDVVQVGASVSPRSRDPGDGKGPWERCREGERLSAAAVFEGSGARAGTDYIMYMSTSLTPSHVRLHGAGIRLDGWNQQTCFPRGTWSVPEQAPQPPSRTRVTQCAVWCSVKVFGFQP